MIIISALPLHMMHQSRLRALNDLLNCSMSLVCTFLCATNQAKAMILEETLDFHKNFAGWKGTEFHKLNKANKKDFTENTPEEEGTKAFAFGTNGDKCTWKSEVISLSGFSIFKSVRF